MPASSPPLARPRLVSSRRLRRPPRRRPFEPHARTRRVLSRFESRAVGLPRRRAGRRRPRRRWRRVFARRRRGGGGGRRRRRTTLRLRRRRGRVRPCRSPGVARRPETAGSRGARNGAGGRDALGRLRGIARFVRDGGGDGVVGPATREDRSGIAFLHGAHGGVDPRPAIGSTAGVRRDEIATRTSRRRRLHGLVRPHRARRRAREACDATYREESDSFDDARGAQRFSSKTALV